MFHAEDGEDVCARVFLQALEPWEHIVDLVTCVATQNNVGEHTHDSENIQGDFPSSNIVAFLREGASCSPLKLEHIALGFEVDEKRSDCCSKRERRSEQNDVAESHDHLKIIVKCLNLLSFKLS